jgi:hypothetical protein
MNIDELYERVTEAILRAETLEDQGPSAEMRAAYLTVSFIEEEITEFAPASGPDGAIARRGAVRAALKSGVPIRARDLAERYLAEPAPPALADELRRMQVDADAALALPALAAIQVVPAARYHVHDAAA